MSLSAERPTFEFVDVSGNVVPAKRHVNPDGSVGGWVAVNAIVEPGAVVEPGALIEPKAKVFSTERVKNGQVVPAP